MTKKRDNLVQVDLGCSKNKTEGLIGIDLDPNSAADIIADLEKNAIPLRENSVDRVVSKHFFEHLEDPIRLLKDIYRVVKDGGEIFIEVPHYSSYISHGIGHKHYFSHKELVQMVKNEIDCDIVKPEITFYKTFRLFGIKFLANKFPVSYERFWAYIFPAENLKITARIRKRLN